ncbi:hypothetical protein [Parasitella parasitica]|uniref:DUF4097 domain-containing protein n=1 Tax=Parasitella parasitica TaxID=35722 RepID=A0A0B7NBD3_9FUNG|nr:hypothetical protein [Parasitella parasitica]
MPIKDLSSSTKLEEKFLDPPPPYTVSDSASQASSSSSYQSPNQYQEVSSSASGANGAFHNSAPSPPHHPSLDYSAVHQQHGLLGKDDNNSLDRKGKAPSNDNYSPQYLGGINFKGFGYDLNRGPIGNVIGLASNIVGYTTNRAIGATSLATGAALGSVGHATNIASSSARTASDSCRAAMGMVENYMNVKMERRDERMRAKSLHKDAKYQQRNIKREQREASKCQKGWACSDRSSIDCGSSSHQPHQPHQEYGSASSDQNSIKLSIKESNKPFTFERSWSGEECSLQTSNGHLSVQGSLTASDAINLETTNANITVQGQLMAKNDITVKTTNGTFILQGPSINTKELKISTTNAPLRYDCFIEAKRIELKSKNAPICLNAVSVGSEMYAKTSNASVEIHINDIVSNSATIEIESSNAPVSVHVPRTFSGYFSVKTNSSAAASVVAKNSESRELKFDTDEQSKKEGRCKNFGNKSNIEIIIKTTNAPATLYQMSNNTNPKSFYNQPDYTAGSSGGYGPQQQTIHKPDEATSADLAPPPPYSPDHATRSTEGASSSAYGSVRKSIEQQQHGLLAPSSPRNVSDVSGSPLPPKRNWNSHSDYQQLPTSEPYDQEAAAAPSSSFARRQFYQDPGCCRKWCKYIIAAILLWLVIFMYSDQLGFSAPAPSHGDGHYGCNSNSVQWTDIPGTIEFTDNLELVIEGRVSNGLVTVVPLQDRHEGAILSDIQVYPPSLQEKMTFEVQNNYNNGESTRLIIQMPQHFENENEDCISANIEIRLPYAANRLFVNVKNIDIDVQPFVKDVDNVEIKTNNGMINLDYWTGESLKLSTQNGEMKVGRLSSGGSVYLENANALVRLTEDIDAKRILSVKNSNGIIEALGSLRADDSIKVETTNAFIKLSKLFAEYVSVSNANNEIQVDYIEAKSQVLATSSNGPVTLSIAGEKNNQVSVINSNADVNLHMTQEFEGSFVFSTSHGDVSINNEQDIEYREKLENLKRGNRKGRGKGDIVVQTSNADVYVAFDING